MSDRVPDLPRRDRLSWRLMGIALACACAIGVVLSLGQILLDSRSQSAEIDRSVDDDKAEEIEEKLKGIDAEAAKVQSSRDLMDHDPHLRERGFYEPVEHFTGATVRVDGAPFRMSDSPARVRFLPLFCPFE